MSDTIFVNGLIIHAYHGVMPHEARVGQPFGLDLVADIDLSAAARTDKLKATVSYNSLVKTASEAFSARRYRLVEAAAGAVAEPCWRAIRRSSEFGSPSASRTRRSPRHSPTSA